MKLFLFRVSSGLILWLTLVSTLLLLYQPTIDAAELPIAVYAGRNDLILQDSLALRDTLGINFIYGNIDASSIPYLDDAGFGLIMWGGYQVYDQIGPLSGESYFKVGATDSTSFPSFTLHRGSADGTHWTNFNPADSSYLTGPIIDSLWFMQLITSKYDLNTPRQFYAQMRMKIDTAGVNIGDSVGTIFVNRRDDSVIVDTSATPDTTIWLGHVWHQRGEIPILVDSALMTGNMVEVPPDPTFFTLGAQGDQNPWLPVRYSFSSSANMKIYIDSLKCYSDGGRRLVENSEFDDDIANGINAFPEFDYWWLCDEPRYDYLRSWAKVADVVKNRSSYGALPLGAPGAIHAEATEPGLQTFIQKTGQDRVVLNQYPFTGGYCNNIWRNDNPFIDYTGSDSIFGEIGLQKKLKLSYQYYLEKAREEMSSPTSTLQHLWVSPQWMWSKSDENIPWDPPNTSYLWRPPTKSELRLQIFMGMCYGVDGFCLWRYEWGNTDSVCGHACWQGSFYDSTSSGITRDSTFWQVMRDDINPYLKAIDSIYLGLTWDKAYACSSGVPLDPPAGALISSISAVSNSPAPNPDLGWFQVGEFTGPPGDSAKYIMLLNRACSQGLYNSTEAPAVTATVKFNRDNLGLGDYVLITDLADTVHYDSGSHEWVGDPCTTYSAVMPDGAIPYTITLRAGEGKLIKIARTERQKRHWWQR